MIWRLSVAYLSEGIPTIAVHFGRRDRRAERLPQASWIEARPATERRRMLPSVANWASQMRRAQTVSSSQVPVWSAVGARPRARFPIR
jgi:hypothetical protein